ncbi:MAG: dTMP kinase [Myxococcales bacterium]|nr:dTMP kinase [Myxococcales bacterium]
MAEGSFIVLEGVDGAGTTTHSRRLVERLRGGRVPVHATQEPSEGPVGGLLRQTLSGRMGTPGRGGVRAPAWHTMALMFAADRMDHLEAEILPNLRDGLIVVCDRYYHSSVAYQSMTASAEEGVIGWIREVNRYARRPDLTIVLDVPPEVAAERRRRRRGADLFDGDPLQAKLGEFYRRLDQHFPEERIEHVSANGPIDDVADSIFGHVEGLL